MIRLVEPDPEYLPGYAAALATGWSPNNGRDVSREQLAAIGADAVAFVAAERACTGQVTLSDGRVVDRLPGSIRWIWSDGFRGAINFRHVPGTEDLPPHVSGHIGYAVVPWRRRQGIATAALGLMLPVARAANLARVLVTCDVGNLASRRVIEKNGGSFAGEADFGDERKAKYWISTSAPQNGLPAAGL